MIRTFRLTPARRLLNRLVRPLVRLGLAGRHTYLLTVRGRRTGRARSTPVFLIENGERWLVAPYGEVGWVRNARAAGTVTLSRAGRTETLTVDEVGADEAAPVLREYVRKAAVVRPYFDAGRDAPLEAFAAEAGRHPVFRLGRPRLLDGRAPAGPKSRGAADELRQAWRRVRVAKSDPL